MEKYYIYDILSNFANFLLPINIIISRQTYWWYSLARIWCIISILYFNNYLFRWLCCMDIYTNRLCIF